MEYKLNYGGNNGNTRTWTGENPDRSMEGSSDGKHRILKNKYCLKGKMGTVTVPGQRLDNQ